MAWTHQRAAALLALCLSFLLSPSMSKASQKLPNIVLLVYDSLRPDYVTPETSPHAFEFFSRQDRVFISARDHFSISHASDSGNFGILNSMVPDMNIMQGWNKESEYRREIGATLLAPPHTQVLVENGYSIGCFAVDECNRFNRKYGVETTNTAFSGCTEVQFFPNFEDEPLVTAALNFLHDSEGPSVIALFLDVTHHNYYYPPEFEKFTPTLGFDYPHKAEVDGYTGVKRTKVLNRYRNSVLYADHLFHTIVESVEKGSNQQSSKRRDFIILVTSDHGEEFWERGAIVGHGQFECHRSRISSPLLLSLPSTSHMPANLQRRSPPFILLNQTSALDVWPTILDAIDPKLFDDVENIKHWSGQSFLRSVEVQQELSVRHPFLNVPGMAQAEFASEREFPIGSVCQGFPHRQGRVCFPDYPLATRDSLSHRALQEFKYNKDTCAYSRISDETLGVKELEKLNCMAWSRIEKFQKMLDQGYEWLQSSSLIPEGIVATWDQCSSWSPLPWFDPSRAAKGKGCQVYRTGKDSERRPPQSSAGGHSKTVEEKAPVIKSEDLEFYVPRSSKTGKYLKVIRMNKGQPDEMAGPGGGGGAAAAHVSQDAGTQSSFYQSWTAVVVVSFLVLVVIIALFQRKVRR